VNGQSLPQGRLCFYIWVVVRSKVCLHLMGIKDEQPVREFMGKKNKRNWRNPSAKNTGNFQAPYNLNYQRYLG